MVFIKDIWKYFFEEDIREYRENVYIDPETGIVYFEEYEYGIKIPRVFTRIGLLKQYIANYIANGDDKKFKREMSIVPDDILVEYFHRKYFPYPYCDEDDEHYKWLIDSKKAVFDYVEQWCYDNNIKCSKKDTGFQTYSYLEYIV
jgi:hypothetical protein